MIDLHCHLLPGIDDGARDLDTALEMARIAVDDGITLSACTPHIYPGVFENTADGIKQAVEALRGHLQAADIPLEITYGADIQMVPELAQGLQSQSMPTIHGGRYFLFEPPHHVAPNHFSDILFEVLVHGYVPIITHPERLTWLDEEHYPWFVEAANKGAWLQITGGALTGRFGKRARYWSERFLGDGLVRILATDAHDPVHRAPLLSEAREAAIKWVGEAEASQLVSGRPEAVIKDLDPAQVPPPPTTNLASKPSARAKPGGGWLKRLFS